MMQILLTTIRERAAKSAVKALWMALLAIYLAAQLIWLGLLGFDAVKLAILI